MKPGMEIISLSFQNVVPCLIFVLRKDLWCFLEPGVLELQVCTHALEILQHLIVFLNDLRMGTLRWNSQRRPCFSLPFFERVWPDFVGLTDSIVCKTSFFFKDNREFIFPWVKTN